MAMTPNGRLEVGCEVCFGTSKGVYQPIGFGPMSVLVGSKRARANTIEMQLTWVHVCDR